MKLVMRKLLVLTMSAIMLFSAVPMRAAAACDHCDHQVMICSGEKMKKINGYTHTYTTEHGGAGGCTVDIYQVYCIDSCNNPECDFVRVIYYPNREIHSSSNHK